LSHLAGVILSVVGLVVLLVAAQGRLWHMTGFLLYGVSLIVLYTASTLYHSLHGDKERIARLRRFDYIAIFLLIAGTYAPLCLIPLRGPWGWGLLITEYSLAAIGIAHTLLWKKSPSWPRITVYVLMGWLTVIATGQLHATLPFMALVWLFAGGALYSVGTVVWALDRPHLLPGRFTAHDLWHIFVLGGSLCHFVLMLCYVAPMV
jgi:hemolysin III